MNYLEGLKANKIPNPYPKDWHPILDKIFNHLRIEAIYTRFSKVPDAPKANGNMTHYEDRTVFMSKKVRKNIFPMWHEAAHAIVGQDKLHLTNFGLDQMEMDEAINTEHKTCMIQFFLMVNSGFMSENKIHKVIGRFNPHFYSCTKREAQESLDEGSKFWYQYAIF